MNRSVLGAAFAMAALVATGCDDERLVVARCAIDDNCGPGEACEDGVCVPGSGLSCDAVAEGKAVLQPTPHVVDFGVVGQDALVRTVTLRNIGNCTLTLFEASLGNKTGSPFSCGGCEESRLPVEIFPMREHALQVTFQAPEVGAYSDALTLLSDDPEFPEIRIPVRALFEGLPRVVAVPDAVVFGFLDVNRTVGRKVQLVNQGTGTARARIVSIKLDQTATDAFSLDGLPDEPVELAPQGEDPRAGLAFNIAYHPRDSATHGANILVQIAGVGATTLAIPVSGISETPPTIAVAPDRLVFGDVKLGEPTRKGLVISNKGGSPLVVTYEWDPGFSPDFSAQPAIIPPIEPGKFFQLEVVVAASKSGDLAAQLHLKTNDPTRTDVIIPISAKALADAGEQVVKVELTYENGSDSLVDDDLRAMDMSLEHPWGFLCSKATPTPDWGDFGRPTWMGLGAKEEPERIVLVQVKRDGEYRVGLQYVEDCSFLPTSLLASVLGVSVEALVAALSKGAIQIDGKDIGAAIAQMCFSRSPSKATVTVFVNGTAIHQRAVTLAKRGDFVYALKVVRQNGVYSVP